MKVKQSTKEILVC